MPRQDLSDGCVGLQHPLGQLRQKDSLLGSESEELDIQWAFGTPTNVTGRDWRGFEETKMRDWEPLLQPIQPRGTHVYGYSHSFQEEIQVFWTCLGTPCPLETQVSGTCLGTPLCPHEPSAQALPSNPAVAWGHRHLGAVLWGHGQVVVAPDAGDGSLAPWQPRRRGRATWLVAVGGPGILAPWGAALPVLLQPCCSVGRPLPWHYWGFPQPSPASRMPWGHCSGCCATCLCHCGCVMGHQGHPT